MGLKEKQSGCGKFLFLCRQQMLNDNSFWLTNLELIFNKQSKINGRRVPEVVGTDETPRTVEELPKPTEEC